ncbi:MAG: multicopper oxidase family protein [Candidatus Methylomirabilales bacterium]
MVEIVRPGLFTEIWGYNGMFPGPTIRARKGHPAVVRFHNDLYVETSVHNHGGHTPQESDGFPDAFILPGLYKDYIYPNIAPGDTLVEQESEFASTQWYHDHAMDITGENVYRGLAGFYLLTDDLEEDLIANGKLPDYKDYDKFGQPFDIPVTVQDKLFSRRGSMIYDTFDHDGFLGDVYVINGKAQPYLNVQRAKYRFRLLNASNARFYELRLTSGSFLQVGNDSWLLGEVVHRNTVSIAPAERADVVIDFRSASGVVYLENILEQDDGRGPDDDRRIPGTPLLKFIVNSGPAINNAPGCVPGAALRPHVAIREDEIVRTREFEFDREHGAWVINDRFFDPDRDDADPQVGDAERWILEGGGGWAHPIHIHLEAQQVQRYDGRLPPLYDSFKKDTVQLRDDQEEIEIFIKFRTFPGRYVFHCHNLEHEDMRMMGVFHVQGDPFQCL